MVGNGNDNNKNKDKKIKEKKIKKSNNKLVTDNGIKDKKLLKITFGEKKNDTHYHRMRAFSKKEISKFLPYNRIKEHVSNIPNFKDNKDNSLDYLIYGIEAKKALIGGRQEEVILLKSLDFEYELLLISKTYNKTEKINLNLLTDISFGNQRGNFLKNKISCSNRKTSFIYTNCISLFKSKGESLDLIFASEHLLNIFSAALLQNFENIFSEDTRSENYFTRPIKKLWNLYDNDKSNRLELSEFSKLIKQLNLNYSKISLNLKDDNSIKEIFEKIDKDNSGKIDYEEFIIFYNLINSGAEYLEIFNKYSNGKQFLTLDDFHNFLIKEQKQKEIKKYEVIEIMLDYKFDVPETFRNLENGQGRSKSSKNTQNEIGDKEHKLNLFEFKNYIIDKRLNNIYDLNSFEEFENMNYPLNDYFIFSSHNTYLTKHQLYGQSSVEMYNFAVLQGCRLVELDCWDGQNGPKITHGHTMTSDISFKEVLMNLRENSFINSSFPVLLSIEMHCSYEQQKIMANMFKDILKDIYIFDENDLPDHYPSPNKLKRKFIIKEAKNLNLNKYEKRERTFFEKIDSNNIIKKFETSLPMNFKPKTNRKILNQKSKEIYTFMNRIETKEEFDLSYNDDKTELIENEDLDQLFDYDEGFFNWESYKIPEEDGIASRVNSLKILSISDKNLAWYSSNEDKTIISKEVTNFQFLESSIQKDANTINENHLINSKISKGLNNIRSDSDINNDQVESIFNNLNSLSLETFNQKANKITCNREEIIENNKKILSNNENIVYDIKLSMNLNNNKQMQAKNDRLLNLNEESDFINSKIINFISQSEHENEIEEKGNQDFVLNPFQKNHNNINSMNNNFFKYETDSGILNQRDENKNDSNIIKLNDIHCIENQNQNKNNLNALIHRTKKLYGATFLSEINEKDDDIESSFRINSRIGDSDILNSYVGKNHSKAESNTMVNKSAFVDSSLQHGSISLISPDKDLENLNHNVIGFGLKNSWNITSKSNTIFSGSSNNIVHKNSTLFNKNSLLVVSNTSLNKNNSFSSISGNFPLQPQGTMNEPEIRYNKMLINSNKKNFKDDNNNNTDLNSINNNPNETLNKSETVIAKKPQKIEIIQEIQELTGLIKRKLKIKDLNNIVYCNFNKKKDSVNENKLEILNSKSEPQSTNNDKEKIKFYPWDCPSIKENNLEEIHRDFNSRKSLIEFCQNSFLKVYPGTFRIDSKNFDAVKAWICGVQIAAMNIQTLDCDQMLINKIFFKKNKNSGIVLKPEFLRSDIKEYKRKYTKPMLHLKIKIINCLMLHTCCEKNLQNNKNETINFESYVIGCWEDDKMNTRFKSKNYEKNFMNCLFNNEIVDFEIYEPELSFWILKLSVANAVVARACVPLNIMNEGVRTVPLYDSNLNEYEDCVLVVMVDKITY